MSIAWKGFLNSQFLRDERRVPRDSDPAGPCGAPDDKLKSLLAGKKLKHDIHTFPKHIFPCTRPHARKASNMGIAITKSFALIAQTLKFGAGSDALQGRPVMPLFDGGTN